VRNLFSLLQAVNHCGLSITASKCLILPIVVGRGSAV
jgi:hypothetical protein